MDNNYYQLEDAEDAAVNKSKNLKRGLAAGAAVLGVGGVSAYGATVLSDNGEAQPELENVTEEELLAGADAMAEGASEKASHSDSGHTTVKPQVEVVQEAEPQVDVQESAIIYDEYGNEVATYDAGTYDDKAFMVFDTDGNGAGDVLAYDANGNGVFEDNEFIEIDNYSYEMGQGKELAILVQDEDGNLIEIDRSSNSHFAHLHNEETVDPLYYNDDLSDINNDFDLSQKTGEVYRDDLAENNPDYNNHGGEQYSANNDDINNDFNEFDAPDYGYTDPSGDLAYDDPSMYDDASQYDA